MKLAVRLCFTCLAGLCLVVGAEELPFRIDAAAYVRQFDPIFRRPIADGWNALPIGNGDLAAIAWQPDDLVFMLNKCDIGGTSQAARLRFETPVKLASRVGLLESRLSLADATLHLTYEGGRLPQEAGWIWRGRTGAAPKPQPVDLGSLQLAAWVPAGQNVLTIDYDETAEVAHPLRLILDRWVEPRYGHDVKAKTLADGLAIVYTMAADKDGQSYAVVLRGDGLAGATFATDGTAATLDLPAATRHRFRLTIAVVTASEAPDPLAAAMALAAPGQDRDRAVHEAWWRDFWGRSFVDSGHPYLSALWHMAVYELGITSRGVRPVQFNGGLNLWSERYRTWGNGFWCHNQSEVYLPVYAANHIDLADPFHQWISRVLPETHHAARKFFATEGAHYPEVMSWNYSVKDPDTPATPSGTGWILSSGTRYALMLWNRYRYTLDESFLRDHAYPVIRDCATFYLNYAKLGQDGRYHVGPGMSWEEGPIGRDAHADGAAWRAIFAIAIEAAEQLKVDAEQVPAWRDRLAKAPPYPVADGVFSIVMRDDGTPEPTDHYQWQLPNLSAVFPYSVIGIGSSAEERALAERTFDRYRFNADAGHEFLPVIAARLGRADWWRDAMWHYIQFFQVFDQGLFNYYNIHGSKDIESGNQHNLHPYLEASGILATGTNEMLLQSYDGVIRVFPATPPHWPARFVLRAEGAFTVASEHPAGGAIPWIAVQADVPGPCRVAIPWDGATRVRQAGEDLATELTDGILTFAASPGSWTLLTPEGAMPPAPVAIGFTRQYSPCRLGNVWFGNRDSTHSHSADFPLW